MALQQDKITASTGKASNEVKSPSLTAIKVNFLSFLPLLPSFIDTFFLQNHEATLNDIFQLREDEIVIKSIFFILFLYVIFSSFFDLFGIFIY